MKKIKLLLPLLLITLIAMMSGFTAAKNSTSYPFTLTDIYKDTVTIDKTPNRIVSISPTLTEIVYSLGAFNKLVGRSNYCDYPSAVKAVPAVGELVNPNVEKIAALKPDLVLASNMITKESYTKLTQLGIKVVIIAGPESFQGTYDMISQVGKILNTNDKAAKLISSMKYKVNVVTSMTKNAKKPSVYYVVGFGKYGDFAATGDTFIGNMIEMAGGVNAAKDGKKWKYSIEQLVKKNPNILICTKFYDTKKQIEETNGYKDLSAVKKGMLLEIDDNLVSRQGPRLADGLYNLAKLIHPQLFK